MRRRSFLRFLLLVALAVAGVGWAFWRSGHQVGEAELVQDDPGRSIGPPEAVERQDVAEAGVSARVPDSIADRGQASVVQIHGTLFVSEVEEEDEHPANGFFDLIDGRHPEAPPLRVEVHDGEWSVNFDLGDKPDILRVVLDGRPAHLTKEVDWSEAGAGEFELSAEWPAPLIIRALAADTGLELDHLEVIRTTVGGPGISYPGSPSQRLVLADDSVSPFDLSRLDDVGHFVADPQYAVRSPGYAWSKFEAKLGPRGERTLHLAPASSLDVEISGPPPPESAKLGIWPAGEDVVDPDAEIDLEGRTRISFDAIPPGSKRVTVGLGESSDINVLGSAEVELVKGGHSRVQVELLGLLPVADVPITGVIRIPTGWDDREFDLFDHPMGIHYYGADSKKVSSVEMSPVPGDPTAVAFTMTGSPGSHFLRLHGRAWLVNSPVFDAGGAGGHLEFPPPEHLSLSFRDATSGEELPVQSVACSADFAGWQYERNWFRQRADSRFEILAPRGRIVLKATIGEEYPSTAVTIDIDADRELSVPVQRSCGIDVQCRLDGIPLSIMTRRIEVRRPDGALIASESGFVYLHRRIPIASTGDYRVTMEAPDGFDPLPPRDVTVEVGRVTDVLFELTRTR